VQKRAGCGIRVNRRGVSILRARCVRGGVAKFRRQTIIKLSYSSSAWPAVFSPSSRIGKFFQSMICSSRGTRSLLRFVTAAASIESRLLSSTLDKSSLIMEEMNCQDCQLERT